MWNGSAHNCDFIQFFNFFLLNNNMIHVYLILASLFPLNLFFCSAKKAKLSLKNQTTNASSLFFLNYRKTYSVITIQPFFVVFRAEQKKQKTKHLNDCFCKVFWSLIADIVGFHKKLHQKHLISHCVPVHHVDFSHTYMRSLCSIHCKVIHN